MLRVGLERLGPRVHLALRTRDGASVDLDMHHRSAATVGALLTATAAAPDDAEHECQINCEFQTKEPSCAR